MPDLNHFHFSFRQEPSARIPHHPEEPVDEGRRERPERDPGVRGRRRASGQHLLGEGHDEAPAQPALQRHADR